MLRLPGSPWLRTKQFLEVQAQRELHDAPVRIFTRSIIRIWSVQFIALLAHQPEYAGRRTRHESDESRSSASHDRMAPM
jgi:hypothetical protein